MENVDFNSLVAQAVTDVFEKKAPDLLVESISKYIGSKGSYPSNSKLIRTNTGRLIDSLTPGKPGNLFSVNYNSDEIKIEYGSALPYANIHEYGGTIQGTERMSKFFWAQYFKTNETYYRNLALRAKNGGVFNIPARPFIGPGIEDFEKNHLPELVDEFVNQILNKAF